MPTIYDEDHDEFIDSKTGEIVRSMSVDDKEKEEEIVAKLRLEGKSFEKIAKILGYASATTFRTRYRGLPTSLVRKVVREDDMPEINKKIYEDIQATFKPRAKKKKTSLKAFLEQTKNQTLKGAYVPRHSLCEKK